jgi:hypothetical protein|tara:strand:+ start:147 stop:395 length:249 start_codon:yes stop_codon:yes gene_type:complete
MTNKYKYFYDNSWTVLKFPKRNRAILYNGNTKTYEFYKLHGDSKKDELVKKVKTVKYPTKMIMFLAFALGVSLALNALGIIL